MPRWLLQNNYLSADLLLVGSTLTAPKRFVLKIRDKCIALGPPMPPSSAVKYPILWFFECLLVHLMNVFWVYSSNLDLLLLTLPSCDGVNYV